MYGVCYCPALFQVVSAQFQVCVTQKNPIYYQLRIFFPFLFLRYFRQENKIEI
jgi:hypothetical protein